MKSGDLLFSSVQFLFGSTLILLGISAIWIGAIPSLYEKCLFILANSASWLLGGGIVLAVVGVLLLILFCQMHRGQYYDVQLPSCKMSATSVLIQESVLRYLSSLDLPYPVDCEVLSLRKGEICLALLFPEALHKERKKLFKQLEKGLPFLLKEHVGYDKPLKLSILFRPSDTRLQRALQKREKKSHRQQSSQENAHLIAPVEDC